MAGPPGRRSRLQLPNYRLSIPPPLPHPLGGGWDPQSFSQPLTHLGSLRASIPRAVAPVRVERLENVDYSPLPPHLSPLIFLFPTFLLSHKFPSNLSHLRLYNGREPDLCTGPTPHIELDLRTGDVWEAVPGDLGDRVLRPPPPSSQGAALGNQGRKNNASSCPEASPSTRRRRQSGSPQPRPRQFGPLVCEGHAREGDAPSPSLEPFARPPPPGQPQS